jgi:hypothetical protein
LLYYCSVDAQQGKAGLGRASQGILLTRGNKENDNNESKES